MIPVVSPLASAWTKASAPVARTWTDGHGNVMTTNLTGIALDPQRRGDTFEYSSTLEDDWVGADFTGGVKFTVRTAAPSSSVTDDTDALAQVSVAGGGIVFTGADFTVTIEESETTEWPTGRLYWDMQAVITGTPNRVYTVAAGTIVIQADVTRST